MYVTLAERLRAQTNPWRPTDTSGSEEDKQRQVFRGFVGGAAFMTKKGYRGLAVETSWSKNILFSYDQDDVEISIQALKSSLADLTDTVVGGIDGAPYSIGDYGFFTEEQFEEQGQVLRDVDRNNAERRKIFFSETEWHDVDQKIKGFAEYGQASFLKVARGDNFGILALRRDAFAVAKFLIERGIDPLKENEIGQDMFVVARESYLSLTIRLKMIAPRQEEYLASIQIRTTLETINRDVEYLRQRFLALKDFAESLREAYRNRISNIQNDVHFLKRCELLNEQCPEEKLWNIAQLEKVQKQFEDISTLIEYSQQKADHAVRLQEEFPRKLQQSRISNLPLTSNALSSPVLSRRIEKSIGGTGSGCSTPTRGTSVLSLPPIAASPSAAVLSPTGNRTPARYNQTQYAPILGTMSKSEYEVVNYR
jgi:hypothetical protein